MNLAIIGSRSISDVNLSEYIQEKPEYIVSGGAIGMDTIAEKWAMENGIKTIVFKPDYKKYGRCAPLKRNHTIIENSHCVLAFWDGKSKGTKYTIDLAQKQGKKVEVIWQGTTNK
jgi:predicted Rossmann fold nucleotide-binding protein DprA/Smf involved in DNA uptake